MTDETNVPVNYDEEWAARAQAASKKVKPQAGRVTSKAGILKLNGDPAPDNTLHTVVVASTFANIFYEEKFDEDDPKNPVCWAYYDSEDDDPVPDPKSTKPQCATRCADCWANQWKSADNGKGKACGNRVLLGIIPAVGDAEDVPEAEVAKVTLAVTSVKEWARYVDKCRSMFGRPPEGMYTDISTKPDPKSQFKFVFTPGAKLANELAAPVFKKGDECLPLLRQSWDPNPEPTEEEIAEKERKASKKKRY